MARILAAMSGGVDSAVAAARAVEAGHDVVGVHLALSAKPGTLRTGSRGCCTIEDAHDARRAADLLGIPFYVWDFAERFTEDVIEDFVAEYAAGRTPNPCMRCNERIKFEALLEKALGLGFDAVCTGHYARLAVDDDGRVELRRAVDADKDQSYVLASLTGDQLRHAMFPVGDTPKSEIRAEAERRGLTVAKKPDSHDICFIPDGDTRRFLDSRIGSTDGALVDDETGEVLGTHGGVHGFTVGQRKGLGLRTPASDGRARYVLSVEPVSRTVRVGAAERLEVREIITDAPVWPGGRPEGGPAECVVQIRAHGGTASAVVDQEGDALRLRLNEGVRGVAPGQVAVLYRPDADSGDLVLGAARISSTR
ncbi:MULTISPECIES: tRNA 2-thiouridine(34) synthase MnmA [Actinoalloteichus]|uniref:tRNA-specific 2-thiouridylase MnmA n=1 Tax=Actinoalloteichus fjordicus TaxID=1612552 RepID=A0AAC9L8X6_9PSEU|nr:MULTISPECIES: tRNA 2-thiouridine(34) synthase MnmA [Actinoalloteichus]APU13363.1 tRNA (5-methylaminomethyl-2-thiouridylate)-methyltransferase [Actinoalloteichus fjordicus]APU19313.1 tRNA (5-methylaminomethyl-2-thiouridylate)-methyltransferase [Actinoalloteichus sp. GBA129-24]